MSVVAPLTALGHGFVLDRLGEHDVLRLVEEPLGQAERDRWADREPGGDVVDERVAAEREVHPRTDRVTVDLGDHRLLQLRERKHCLADVAHVVQRVETLDAVGGAREVGSRAKRIACARHVQPFVAMPRISRA